MPFTTSSVSWLSILVFSVPLAILLLIAIPSGFALQLAAHVGILVGGGSIALALAGPDKR